MSPLALNLFIALAVLAFFFVQGSLCFTYARDRDSYFLIDRVLPGTDYAASFAAASTSLATVLFFFVTFGLSFGVYILLAPLTSLLGAWIYYRLIVPPLQSQGFFKSTGEVGRTVSLGTTLGAYVQDRYRSKAVTRSILFITFVGMLSILLIELYVGVRIFSIYVQPEYVDWALVLVALVVFVYTGLGGLVAVIRTDRFQIFLIFTATATFLGWLVVKAIGTPKALQFTDLFPPPASPLLLPVPLFLNILIVNIFLLPALLRTWQMAAASPSPSEVKKGVLRGAYLYAVLTVMFVLIGILFFNLISPPPTGGEPLTLLSILSPLYSSPEVGPFGSFVVFPLFFAAALAALISTADSALIPLLQSIFTDFEPMRHEWRRSYVLVATAALLIVAVGLYFIVFRILAFDLMNWLFTIFSFLILTTPCIVLAARGRASFLQTRLGRSAALISLWGGLAVALSFSLVGNALNVIELVQLNSPLSAIFGSVVLLLAWLIGRRAPYSDQEGAQELNTSREP